MLFGELSFHQSCWFGQVLSFYRAFSWNLPFYRGFCSFFDDYEMTGSGCSNMKWQIPTSYMNWKEDRLSTWLTSLLYHKLYSIISILSSILIYLVLCPSRRCQGGIQRSLRVRKFQPTFSARSCSQLFLETPTWLVPSPPIELGARKVQMKSCLVLFCFRDCISVGSAVRNFQVRLPPVQFF